MTPADPGLQAERTDLAWRRSTLAMVVGCLVVARWAHGSHAAHAVEVTVLALVLAMGAVFVRRSVRRRARTIEEALRRTDQPMPGAAALLALSAVVVLAAVSACAQAVLA